MEKAVGYVRVSTDLQLDGYSINAQIERIEDYCKSKNITLEKIYNEESGSGSSLKNRPEFIQMIQDVLSSENTEKTYIVVWSSDRFARKLLDAKYITELISKKGHHLVCISEGINTEDPYARFALDILLAFSENTRHKINQTCKEGMRRRAVEGYFNGGRVFGYTSTPSKTLKVNPDEAKVVEFIFDRYTDDHWGYKKIAHFLNTQYTEAKLEREWDVISVKTIVTNPIYAGYIRWGERNGERKVYEGKHQAIISQAKWEKATKIFDSKSKKPIKIHKGSYFLSGLLKCPECGSSMVQHKSKGGKYLYYQCSRNKTKGLCNSNLINKEAAEQKVLSELSSKLQSPEYENLLIEKINSQIKLEQIPIKRQISMIEKEEKDLQRKVNEVIDLYTSQTISKETLQDQLSRYESMKVDLKTRKQMIETKLSLSSSQNTTFIVKQVLNNFEGFFCSFGDTEKKELLREIISDIHVEEVDTGGKRKKRQISEIHYHFDEKTLKEIAS
ncbi:recombinase family protein [Niallia sp. FSL W8-0954]|uniref:recombinase family protein n=1 Tax=Niallia sp. FSL W8-0954 TaxID=2975338 RepID=UPI0030F74E96